MPETGILYYRVASSIPSGSRVRFTTLSHFYPNLYHSRTTISVLTPALNVTPIVLIAFLIDTNLVIILTTVII